MALVLHEPEVVSPGGTGMGFGEELAAPGTAVVVISVREGRRVGPLGHHTAVFIDRDAIAAVAAGTSTT